MDRRKFLAGIGTAAVGSSALVGSGAFSRADANREFDLAVAADENAYLGLSPNDNAYVNDNNDTSTIEFNFAETFSSSVDGTGLNNKADTEIADVFDIVNQADRDLFVWVPGPDPTSGGSQSVEMVAYGKDITFPSDETKSIPTRSFDTTSGGAIRLSPGDSAGVDFRFLVWGSNDAREWRDCVLQFRAIDATNNSRPTSESDWTNEDLPECEADMR